MVRVLGRSTGGEFRPAADCHLGIDDAQTFPVSASVSRCPGFDLGNDALVVGIAIREEGTGVPEHTPIDEFGGIGVDGCDVERAVGAKVIQGQSLWEDECQASCWP